MMGNPVEAVKPANVKKTHLLVEVEMGGAKPVRSVASRSGNVRWGPALGIEISYPIDGVDKIEYLFKSAKGGAQLMLRPDMVGEVHAGDSTLKLEDLEAWGLVEGKGWNKKVQLTREMSGWFNYRGLNINFHFGPPPPVVVSEKVTRTGVPLRFKRSILPRDELPYALFSWFVYAVVGWFCFILATTHVPDDVKPEAVAERFAKLIYQAPQAKTRVKKEMDKKKEDEAKAKEEAKAEEVVEETAEAEEKPVEEVKEEQEKAEEVAEEAAEPEEKPQTIEERRESIRKEVAKKGLLGVLGGRGSAATARRSSAILSGSARASDLDKVLDKVKGIRAGRAEGDWKGQKIDADGVLDEAARSAAAASDHVVALDKSIDAEIESIDTAEFDELSMKEAMSVVHRTVETYLGGLRYLYNRELRKNPDLEGKITISITIDPDGNVVEAKVKEATMDAPALEKAILARVRRWTFPPVSPKTITVTYPFVFFPTM